MGVNLTVLWRCHGLTRSEEGLEEKAGRQRKDSNDSGNFKRWKAECFTDRSTHKQNLDGQKKTNILGKDTNNVLPGQG